MTTTSGMEHRSRSALINPMEYGSSHCASSTNKIQPGREGCAGAACVARPRREKSIARVALDVAENARRLAGSISRSDVRQRRKWEESSSFIFPK